MTIWNSRKLVMTALVATMGAAVSVSAQQPLVVRGGQSFIGGTSMQYASPWSGSMRWLMVPAIQKDLELVDDQVQKVAKIQQELQQEMQEAYKQIRDVPAADRQQKYYDMNTELAERTEDRLREILLPEQSQRLKQIDLQMRLRSYWSLGQQLTSDDFAHRLAISDRQKDKLLELQQELRDEIQRKTQEFYARINAEAEKKMLGALTSAQRRELEAMVGERFEWPPYGTAPNQGGQKK